MRLFLASSNFIANDPGEPPARENRYLTFIARKPRMAKKQAPSGETKTQGLSALNIGLFAIYLIDSITFQKYDIANVPL